MDTRTPRRGCAGRTRVARGGRRGGLVEREVSGCHDDEKVPRVSSTDAPGPNKTLTNPHVVAQFLPSDQRGGVRDEATPSAAEVAALRDSAVKRKSMLTTARVERRQRALKRVALVERT